MTLNEATTLIASELGKELDDPFKLMLAERIQVWRSRLIKNSADKNQTERKFFRQVIFIPMEVQKDVPCCTTFPGCEISVTTVDVPAPLRANSILFDYVGSVNGMNPFQESTGGFLAFMSQAKYSKQNIRYTWAGSRISIFGNKQLPMVRIEGIFDNPEEAAKLNCTLGNSTDCDFWNKEYPVTNDIMQLIIQSITSIDFQRGSVPEDKDIPVALSLPNQDRRNVIHSQN
jgi:hypothetical protein